MTKFVLLWKHRPPVCYSAQILPWNSELHTSADLLNLSTTLAPIYSLLQKDNMAMEYSSAGYFLQSQKLLVSSPILQRFDQ